STGLSPKGLRRRTRPRKTDDHRKAAAHLPRLWPTRPRYELRPCGLRHAPVPTPKANPHSPRLPNPRPNPRSQITSRAHRLTISVPHDLQPENQDAKYGASDEGSAMISSGGKAPLQGLDCSGDSL